MCFLLLLFFIMERSTIYIYLYHNVFDVHSLVRQNIAYKRFRAAALLKTSKPPNTKRRQRIHTANKKTKTGTMVAVMDRLEHRSWAYTSYSGRVYAIAARFITRREQDYRARICLTLRRWTFARNARQDSCLEYWPPNARQFATYDKNPFQQRTTLFETVRQISKWKIWTNTNKRTLARTQSTPIEYAHSKHTIANKHTNLSSVIVHSSLTFFWLRNASQTDTESPCRACERSKVIHVKYGAVSL